MVPITNKGSPSLVWTGTIYELLEIDDSKWKLVNGEMSILDPVAFITLSALVAESVSAKGASMCIYPALKMFSTLVRFDSATATLTEAG
jgi:hypothetical protein